MMHQESSLPQAGTEGVSRAYGPPLPPPRELSPPPQPFAPPRFAGARREARTDRWDLLLVCVAVYVATAVGRVHQLFPVLLPLKPALLAAVVAVGLYVLQQSGQRRVDRLRSRTTTCLLALLLWAALSVLTALNQGVAFRYLTDFVKTVLL